MGWVIKARGYSQVASCKRSNAYPEGEGCWQFWLSIMVGVARCRAAQVCANLERESPMLLV